VPGVRRADARAALALTAVLLQAACRTPAATLPDARDLAHAERLEARLVETFEPPSGDALRVRLAFGAGADLDLYVTDPRTTETVYFAMARTRGGGRLLRDARCADEAPRSDAVVYDHPAPGVYRIGVDYHRACERPARSQVFVVEAAQGGRVERVRGFLRPGEQRVAFLRFAVGAARAPAAR